VTVPFVSLRKLSAASAGIEGCVAEVEGADRLRQRDGVDQSSADYRDSFLRVVATQIKVGSTVTVRLFISGSAGSL
jgi:hypothetical protein